MEPERRPFNVALVAAVVVRAIDDIDGTGDDERDVLLADLVSAAWGSAWAWQQ